jgi:DNA-binding LacI/PurR family transcriptional regulator
MTLSKIAKLANVSVSTASKAFSMSSDISEQMREHVFEVAKKHGCFKKFYNVKYPRLVIAIVCPELSSIHYGSLIEDIQKELSALGCEVCISNTMFSQVASDTSIGYFSDYSSVDGIISISEIEHKQELSVPCICPSDVMRVGKKGIDAAVEYFAQNAVTDIGFIGEALTQSKLDDFRFSMEKHGVLVRDDMIVISEGRFENGGYEGMKSLLENKIIPRAVVCAYDNMAMGVIRCIHDAGFSVPGDIAVIGMDNIPETNYFIPSIASIEYGNMQKARLLARGIVNEISGVKRNIETVDEEFVLRESAKI